MIKILTIIADIGMAFMFLGFTIESFKDWGFFDEETIGFLLLLVLVILNCYLIIKKDNSGKWLSKLFERKMIEEQNKINKIED